MPPGAEYLEKLATVATLAAHMKAFRAVVRGQSIWAVSLGKKQGVAQRQRIFGKTKEEAVARAEEKLAERQLHGSELAGISATHRAIVVEWRDRLTPEQMRAAFLAFEGSQISTRTVATCVADYILAKTTPDDRGRCVWSKEHSSSARARFTRFVAAFGGKVLGKPHSRRAGRLHCLARRKRGFVSSLAPITLRVRAAASLDRRESF